jgi:chemotaxis family two-component system response regulator Rcp1
MRPARSRPVEILIVDDSQADIRLTREALKESTLRNNLHVAEDGIEAMAFLHRQGPYQNAPTPDLILLDLNLPRKDGRQVLAEVKNDPVLQRIPVVILTTSSADQDIVDTYNLHANCYVVKPVGLNEFLRIVKAIEDFWLTIVRLPSHGEAGR